ncbi:hypothetical protein FBUS_09560 [Fasciolopsis buskii]|uniref:Uncharacterized protein n=1 Tax=Fasciolopsis buskii TaxID=27845 RepID=A0A8E0RZG3_9TREM|nr:hypothetical protein FBUS_09560 [Fasciolopsis buski]
MEKKRSQSLILTPDDVKARRLKTLQTIEARRLEMVNRQLSRAETKALRQLDFQRSQFRRRLSDVTGHSCSSRVPTEGSSASPVVSGDCSPANGSQALTTGGRMSRSLCKIGRPVERQNQLRAPKTSTENMDVSVIQEIHGSCQQETRPPFWIRIPSMGISSRDHSTDLSSPNEADSPTTNNDSVCSSITNLVASPIVISDLQESSSPASTKVERFTFPPGGQTTTESGTRRLPDMRPMWLKALYKLREQRYARLHGQQAEECEELAALVTGCSLTNSLPANSKRITPKQGAAVAR